jgi:hypothetical protein
VHAVAQWGEQERRLGSRGGAPGRLGSPTRNTAHRQTQALEQADRERRQGLARSPPAEPACLGQQDIVTRTGHRERRSDARRTGSGHENVDRAGHVPIVMGRAAAAGCSGADTSVVPSSSVEVHLMLDHCRAVPKRRAVIRPD